MKYKEKRSDEISMKEIRPEMIDAGLNNVCYHFNNKMVCLHSDIEYGLPDSLVIHLITNFNCLAMKKLIVTDFPISEEPEDWTGLLEGDKYVIEEVPAGLAENDISQSIAVEEFLKKHKKPFKVKDNCNNIAHIEMIKEADIVVGFPGVNILKPYVKLIERYNKNYFIGGFVTEENFSDYLEVFSDCKLKINSVMEMHVMTDYYNDCKGYLIWMDNFEEECDRDTNLYACCSV